MDVSGWTVDQKMRLPDWCFGQRRTMRISHTAVGAGVDAWAIKEKTLPENICIWTAGYWYTETNSTSDYLRMGFRATVPTSIGEMDEAVPAEPENIGIPPGPEKMYMPMTENSVILIPTRKGVVATGLFLVMQVHSGAAKCSGACILTYSEMPTSMAGWLAHHKV